MKISTIVFSGGEQHLGVSRHFMRRIASGCNGPFISVKYYVLAYQLAVVL
jgi:hypothetical protein